MTYTSEVENYFEFGLDPLIILSPDMRRIVVTGGNKVQVHHMLGSQCSMLLTSHCPISSINFSYDH